MPRSKKEKSKTWRDRKNDYAIHAIVDSTFRTDFSLIPTVREDGLPRRTIDRGNNALPMVPNPRI